MGSLISLGVGRLEVDWGKNAMFRNHSTLFLPSDLKAATYYYADNIRERKPAYVRKLESVKQRLELLGYTMQGCRDHFLESATRWRSYFDQWGEDELSITFNDFVNVLRCVDVDKQHLPGDLEDDYDPGEYALDTILRDPQFVKTLGPLPAKRREWYLGLFFEDLNPYVILRLLAENPANLRKSVVWRHIDAIEGGWASEDGVFEHLADSERFLLVTEGSSDSLVLERGIQILKPDIADFFYFVDMSDNYPFTGTGNIVRFCQGLAKIRIQNRVLVILDNDAAGNAALSRLRDSALPKNMKVIVLPHLPDFDAFPTVGPAGVSLEPVNGRAVSMEMFLDLSYETNDSPAVRWTSYDKSAGVYQGELVDKDKYVSRFLKQGWRDKRYDKSKLDLLLRHIVSSACSLGSEASAAVHHDERLREY